LAKVSVYISFETAFPPSKRSHKVTEEDLIEIRGHASAILALTAKSTGPLPDPRQYRIGGNLQSPLNHTGIAEIHRRFSAGETNKTIAKGMTISTEGVRSRRRMWNALVQPRRPIRRKA
jgi:DNA-binding CsgD family transcriptional regulator